MFDLESSFLKCCKENGLPLRSLSNSIKNKERIYMNINDRAKRNLIRSNHYRFKGWYAIELSRGN